MKNIKKILALVLAFVLVIGATIAGTVAYLTSTKTVTNTFAMGNVIITLDETKVDTQTGLPVSPAERTEEGNLYELVPGRVCVKDPTVHVDKSSEPCFVRMVVTIENWKTVVEAIQGGDTSKQVLPQDLLNGTWNKAYWPCTYFHTDNNGTATLTFSHQEVIWPGTDGFDCPPLFEEIMLPKNVEYNADFNDVKITIKAEAIQAEGFIDEKGDPNADAAFKALSEQLQ